jgi:hypothetical protein
VLNPPQGDLACYACHAVFVHPYILSFSNHRPPCQNICKPLECLGYPSEQRSQRDATEVDKVVQLPA